MSPRGYIIYNVDYSEGSGGVWALHALARDLKKRGFETYIAHAKIVNPTFGVDAMSDEQAKSLCASGNFVAIYPETIYGNPLDSPFVVRWVMNRPGLLGGFERYSNSELIFLYSDVFAAYVQNKISGKLYYPTINEDIFYPGEKSFSERRFESYFVGKSIFKKGYFDSKATPQITRFHPSKKQVGEMLRQSRRLYCFDNSTILIYEAVLCGCPVVVIPDGTQTLEDYQKLELGMDGIAWGNSCEERKRADSTVPLFRSQYENIKKDFPQQLENFIRLTQDSRNYLIADAASEIIEELRWLRKKNDDLARELFEVKNSRLMKVTRILAEKLPGFFNRILMPVCLWLYSMMKYTRDPNKGKWAKGILLKLKNKLKKTYARYGFQLKKEST